MSCSFFPFFFASPLALRSLARCFCFHPVCMWQINILSSEESPTASSVQEHQVCMTGDHMTKQEARRKWRKPLWKKERVWRIKMQGFSCSTYQCTSGLRRSPSGLLHHSTREEGRWMILKWRLLKNLTSSKTYSTDPLNPTKESAQGTVRVFIFCTPEVPTILQYVHEAQQLFSTIQSHRLERRSHSTWNKPITTNWIVHVGTEGSI